ncbi:XRE family transcriptional regulator [Stenotrophomonas sp. Sm6012]|uniref:helix-turn-helix domain-containing protein n=1 Tax=Stenotrophomonas sp. Sm6012 TaxID=3002745 RepID=UPI0027E5898F|nr:XRE family transcriptional regulator [Stenotrophomonas sp. Sm6012]MDQ7280510.1 XRE family transcriptional regulator [Stenotrophomonas sp. Sm6012]
MTIPLANAALIKVARQARGMSQVQLAKAAGVTQAAISKCEAGLMQPGAELIESLARALTFPASLFYETDPVFGVPVSINYRKNASVGAKATDKLEAEINLRLLHLRRLLSSMDYQPELTLPRFDIDDYNGDAARVAQLVRRHWGVPSGPLHDLTALVERAGCIVLPCEFESIGVFGLTLQPPGLPTCIFLNQAMPGDRQRFTLAHELAHAIMHRMPSPDMEREADVFASELLMPAQDIRGDLMHGITLPRLAALKPIWKVSMGALLMRAKALGCITDMQSTYLWRQMSKLGYRMKEPVEVDFAPEQSTAFNDILRAHAEDLGYTMADFEAMLHMHASELNKMYKIERPDPAPKLRLLKFGA